MGLQLVSPRVGQRLRSELLFFLQLIGIETSGVSPQLSAVKLNDGGADRIQKRTIVGHEDDRAAPRGEQFLKPDNGVNIQVVGGLIKQEHVGCGHQGLGKRHPFLVSTREVRDLFATGKPQAMQRLLHPLFPVPSTCRIQCGLNRLQPVMVGIA